MNTTSFRRFVSDLRKAFPPPRPVRVRKRELPADPSGKTYCQSWPTDLGFSIVVSGSLAPEHTLDLLMQEWAHILAPRKPWRGAPGIAWESLYVRIRHWATFRSTGEGR